MGKKKNKKKLLSSPEHCSDRRTAQFVSHRISEIQDQLFDLLADLKTFEHHSEIEDVGWCLRMLQQVRTKYQKFIEDGVWP